MPPYKSMNRDSDFETIILRLVGNLHSVAVRILGAKRGRALPQRCRKFKKKSVMIGLERKTKQTAWYLSLITGRRVDDKYPKKGPACTIIVIVIVSIYLSIYPVVDINIILICQINTSPHKISQTVITNLIPALVI